MAVKKAFILAALSAAVLLTSSPAVFAQGCVAVRPMSCSASGLTNNLGLLEKGQWQLSGSYRYFKSFRHFRGDVEEHERIEQDTQVENLTHAIDLGVNYGLTHRVGLLLNLPLVYYDRSSLYEHYGNSAAANPEHKRFHTGAQGLGDLRFGANYWVFNPATAMKGNLLLGLSIKAPTGDANVSDEFHRRTRDGRDSVITRPVDQSIQLGDGKWGLNVEMQAFRSVFSRAAVFFNGFYLFNPSNVNNTLTRGTLTGADPITAYHSVADQFAARLGLNYAVLPSAGLSASLCGRIEGVPSHDLFGESQGFRRPGYVFSIEPSMTLSKGMDFTLNVPIALYRNRTKSVFDLADPTGQRHGDAAFADYLVNLVASYKFGKKQHGAMNMPPQINIPIEQKQ